MNFVFRTSIIAPMICAALAASCSTGGRPLDNISLSEIGASGWLETMLINEKEFIAELDSLIYPFTQNGWGTEPFLKKTRNGTTGFWVPYEQSAYFNDGVLRCGLILNDSSLIEKAGNTIYATIGNVSENGIIESVLCGEERSRWPHAVFFRAWRALYETTGDRNIINTLEKHFLNDTVRLSGRDLCNIETMAWVYKETGNKNLYDKILDMYGNPGNSTFKEDMSGSFTDGVKKEVHGVTYNEMLKLPIIMYNLTGDKKFLDEARAGFANLDRFHMLPDGVNSSEEGVSGKSSRNAHETCDIIDYMWTCSYMLKTTAETEWADRMERALFNAGMGAITKNFDAHQYYSCPNQVFCDDHSSHILTYEDSRLAYRLAHKPPCCTGNVTRMFPVFVGTQWLKGKDNALYKALYGPGSVTHHVGDRQVTVSEESVYPYSDRIMLSISGDEAEFPLYVRIPGWCRTPSVKLNGKVLSGATPGEFFRIRRKWNAGDIVELEFPKEAEFVNWDNYESMTVNYGPLLFALPVEAATEEERIGNPAFKCNSYRSYRKTPLSDWNYILGVDGKDNSMIKVETRPVENPDNPWSDINQAITIKVPAYKDPSWKEQYHKVEGNGEAVYAPMTPPMPARGAMIFVLRKLQPEAITLVPYGSTELRMSMFPFWKETDIAPEILATESD
ncbi:MAG: beta-L-arabinofuranosidase domain-containing protein [Candidatus Cryptobacteroides sp.]